MPASAFEDTGARRAVADAVEGVGQRAGRVEDAVAGDRVQILGLGGHRRVRAFFFFNDTATTEIYTLSLHDALPICLVHDQFFAAGVGAVVVAAGVGVVGQVGVGAG